MQNNTSESNKDIGDPIESAAVTDDKKNITHIENRLLLTAQNTLRIKHIELMAIFFSVVVVIILGFGINSHFLVRNKIADFQEREDAKKSEENDDTEDLENDYLDNNNDSNDSNNSNDSDNDDGMFYDDDPDDEGYDE